MSHYPPTPPTSSFTILIADDNPLYRSGLKRILNAFPASPKIVEASNGAECLELAKFVAADAILLDASMPVMGGLECMKLLNTFYPSEKVIAMYQFDESLYMDSMQDAGVLRFIVKTASRTELIELLQSHIPWLCNPKRVSTSELSKLQKRENEILQLLCDSFSSKKIAEKLHISKHTVDRHRRNILKKTGTGNTAGLVSWALSNGFTLLDRNSQVS